MSVEFVFLEQESSRLRDMPDINSFIESICDLENCSFRTYFPGYAPHKPTLMYVDLSKLRFLCSSRYESPKYQLLLLNDKDPNLKFW